jgi:hypothetical protein
MSIVMSDSELIWVYVPIPKDATQIEVEKWFRDNAYTVSVQFIQRRDAAKAEEALFETDEGKMIQ